MIIEIIFGVILFLLAIWDLKFRELPRFITSSLILALIMIYPQNIIWGLAGFVFGMVLYELDFTQGRFFGGMADVKVLAIIGMFVVDIYHFAGVMLSTGILGVGVSIIRNSYYQGKNKEMPEEFAFIPILFVVYLVTIVIRNI